MPLEKALIRRDQVRTIQIQSSSMLLVLLACILYSQSKLWDMITALINAGHRLPHQASRRRWQSCCPWAVKRLWSHRREWWTELSSGGQVLYVKTSETMTLSGSKRSAWGLDLLGCLHAVSIAILLTSVHVAKGSHSTGASSVSSLGFGWPVISSLLGVEATTTLSVLSLLLVEVWSSGKSTDAMGMHVLLTSRWCSSLQT